MELESREGEFNVPFSVSQLLTTIEGKGWAGQGMSAKNATRQRRCGFHRDDQRRGVGAVFEFVKVDSELAFASVELSSMCAFCSGK